MALTNAETFTIALSGFSVIVSIRAYWLAREAHAITAKEHEWKAEAREEEIARERWCKEQMAKLAAIPDGAEAFIDVEPKHHIWALWGDGRFFRALKNGMGGVRLIRFF
jgi:hypothetical protein